MMKIASLFLSLYMVSVYGWNSTKAIGQYRAVHHHNGKFVDGMAGMKLDAMVPSKICSSVCNVNKNSDYFGYENSEALMAKFVDLGNLHLVSEVRKRASFLLLRATMMSCQPGDIVETGVFTGSTSAVIMKILLELDQCNRKFWVFDSFEGLPKQDPKDQFAHMKLEGGFKSSFDEFSGNLKNLSVWDEKVMIVSKGWFSATIPVSPVEKIAFLRLDGDLYVSTKDALDGLYPKLNRGGYIYIDDYGSFPGCRVAVEEYRTKFNITTHIHKIHEFTPDKRVEAIWWRKE